MKVLTKVVLILAFVLIALIKFGCTKEAPTNSNIQPKKGSIYVDSNPTGAEIFLQGTATGKVTPDSITDLAPDSYDLIIKLNDFADSSLVVGVKAGLKTTVYVDFTQSTGNLFVSSSPKGALIFLDNINTQKSTPDSFHLGPRAYEVKLKFNTGDEVIRNMLIEAGKTSYIDVNYFGTLLVNSSPSGGEVILDGIATGKVTPAILDSLFPGQYEVTLKLAGFSDISVTVQIHSGYQELFISYPIITLYGPVRIYETAGTTANEPAGLDLSSGMAYGVSSIEKDSVDIYYSTDGTGGQGFLVQSADLNPNLIRETDFFVGSSENLFDEEDSPDKNIGTWTNNIDDRETNYVFLYDHDGHYSKLKIVNMGGGVAGEPFWVEVLWYYNNTLLDNRF